MPFWGGRDDLTSIEVSLPIDELRRRSKILIIDDDPNSFPSSILRSEGYSIEHWDKIESMDRLEKGEFDIIFLDIGGIAAGWVAEGNEQEDGLGILQHLKDYNPAQIVVAFSGQTFDLGKNKFWQMADDALSKPTDAIKCKEVIDHLLREKITVRHLWCGLEKILLNEGKSPSEIKKLRRKVSAAISKKKGSSAVEILKSTATSLEGLGKVSALASKLIDLCGQ